MKIALHIAAAMLIGTVALPAPAPAQSQGRVLVIYGNDRCPTGADGEEIVVCVKRPENERYRIPEELRRTEITPENESWADRAAALETVGASGIGSCSPSGSGGASGCARERFRAARAENAAKREATANSPLPR